MSQKHYRWWTDFLEDAIESDEHTVELVPAERYGVQVEINDVPMFDGIEGYPWETFTLVEREKLPRLLTEQGFALFEKLETRKTNREESA